MNVNREFGNTLVTVARPVPLGRDPAGDGLAVRRRVHRHQAGMSRVVRGEPAFALLNAAFLGLKRRDAAASLGCAGRTVIVPTTRDFTIL
jgi:hypothetical protein